ncbi:MAG: hypothetical protein RR847_01455 [Bacilli bacterium]
MTNYNKLNFETHIKKIKSDIFNSIYNDITNDQLKVKNKEKKKKDDAFFDEHIMNMYNENNNGNFKKFYGNHIKTIMWLDKEVDDCDLFKTIQIYGTLRKNGYQAISRNIDLLVSYEHCKKSLDEFGLFIIGLTMLNIQKNKCCLSNNDDIYKEYLKMVPDEQKREYIKKDKNHKKNK